jgi:hypothetical protein
VIAVVDPKIEFLVEIRPTSTSSRWPSFMDDSWPTGGGQRKRRRKAREAGANHMNLTHQLVIFLRFWLVRTRCIRANARAKQIKRTRSYIKFSGSYAEWAGVAGRFELAGFIGPVDRSGQVGPFSVKLCANLV